jgi:hypothetical protein
MTLSTSSLEFSGITPIVSPGWKSIPDPCKIMYLIFNVHNNVSFNPLSLHLFLISFPSATRIGKG